MAAGDRHGERQRRRAGQVERPGVARDVDDERRLVADEALRRGMIDGLRGWVGAPSRRGQVIETIEHQGWRVELVGAELGIVGFAPDLSVPITEYNRPRLGALHIGTTPVIFEAAFRYTR